MPTIMKTAWKPWVKNKFKILVSIYFAVFNNFTYFKKCGRTAAATTTTTTNSMTYSTSASSATASFSRFSVVFEDNLKTRLNVLIVFHLQKNLNAKIINNYFVITGSQYVFFIFTSVTFDVVANCHAMLLNELVTLIETTAVELIVWNGFVLNSSY